MTERFTDADLEDLFGSAPPVRGRWEAEPVDPDAACEAALPNLDELVQEQNEAAVYRLHEDSGRYPQFRALPSVAAMTGAIAPTEVALIAGRVASGKSLFAQNFLRDLIGQEVPTLYMGTEQTAQILKIKQACLMAGVSPRLMLKATAEQRKTEAYLGARDQVQDQLKWLKSPGVKELAIFANTPHINREILRTWTVGGIRKYGIECVIVDHVDHMSHGPGVNAREELTATVRLAHQLATDYEIPMILMSQVKRTTGGGDPLKLYGPPDVEDLAGSSDKERVASLVLTLWRPLRAGIAPKDLRTLHKATQYGMAPGAELYEPRTMGVKLCKDRLGDTPGLQCRLHVGVGGVLMDDPGLTHGIRTNGSIV